MAFGLKRANILVFIAVAIVSLNAGKVQNLDFCGGIFTDPSLNKRCAVRFY